MRKVYYDVTGENSCVSVFVFDAEVIPAGATLYIMSRSDKNKAYDDLAKKYGVHFIFEDHVPEIDFYTVPRVDIFAESDFGGFYGTLGRSTDIESDAPVLFMDQEKNFFLAAPDLRTFLEHPTPKDTYKAYNDIEVYDSKHDAKEALSKNGNEFLESYSFPEIQ